MAREKGNRHTSLALRTNVHKCGQGNSKENNIRKRWWLGSSPYRALSTACFLANATLSLTVLNKPTLTEPEQSYYNPADLHYQKEVSDSVSSNEWSCFFPQYVISYCLLTCRNCISCGLNHWILYIVLIKPTCSYWGTTWNWSLPLEIHSLTHSHWNKSTLIGYSLVQVLLR